MSKPALAPPPARGAYHYFSSAFLIGIHAACLLVFVVAFSWKLVALAAGAYLLRMWAITAGYHRYFSHRSYKTSRAFQFVLAWLGASALQRGPLWWASWHRVHHKYSDRPGDTHSPVRDGFWHAHMGWFCDGSHDAFDAGRVRDLARFPELRWLERYHWVPVLAHAAVCALLAGLPGLIWGFVISTVALWHATFAINSLAHVWGSRRYATSDTSRNNPLLALLTLGEGWHNNHHHYMNSARQGFFWWELDVSYLVLRALARLGVVWDLRAPPPHVLHPDAPREAQGPSPELRAAAPGHA